MHELKVEGESGGGGGGGRLIGGSEPDCKTTVCKSDQPQRSTPSTNRTHLAPHPTPRGCSPAFMAARKWAWPTAN